MRPIVTRHRMLKDLIEYDKGLTEYCTSLKLLSSNKFILENATLAHGLSDPIFVHPLEVELHKGSGFASSRIYRNSRNIFDRIKANDLNLVRNVKAVLPNNFYYSLPGSNINVLHEYFQQFNSVDSNTFCYSVIKELLRNSINKKEYDAKLCLFWMTLQFYKEMPYKELKENYLFTSIRFQNFVWVAFYAMLRRLHPEIIEEIKNDFLISYTHSQSEYDISQDELEAKLTKRNPGFMVLVLFGLFSGQSTSILNEGKNKDEDEILDCAIAMTDSYHQGIDQYFPRELHKFVDYVSEDYNFVKSVFCKTEISLDDIYKSWDIINQFNQIKEPTDMKEISISLAANKLSNIPTMYGSDIKQYLQEAFNSLMSHLRFVVRIESFKERTETPAETNSSYIMNTVFISNVSQQILSNEVNTYIKRAVENEPCFQLLKAQSGIAVIMHNNDSMETINF